MEDKVYALYAATGLLKWSYTTGGQVFSSPAVVSGVVYVGSYDGKVYAFGIPFHYVPLTRVASSKTVVCQGFSTSINVTVADQGSNPETFNVTAYVNGTLIGTQEVIALPSGNSTELIFAWNTTGFAYGNYTLSAYSWPVPGETNTENKNFTDGWIIVTCVGDLTGNTPNLLDFVPDGQVDMKDVGTVARFFQQAAPPAPSNCDITGPTQGVPDGIIDMRDIGLVARHFGDHYHYP